jgi:hypothetical protein
VDALGLTSPPVQFLHKSQRVKQLNQILVVGVLVTSSLLCGCEQRPDLANDTAFRRPGAANATGARESDVSPQKPEQVVEELGRRMRLVSVLAPADLAAKAMRMSYAGFVDPKLLEVWSTNPTHAPGRQTSSPWPDRIEVQSASLSGDQATVIGKIVEATSAGETGRVPVEVGLKREGSSWLIIEYAVRSETATHQKQVATLGADPQAAIQVLYAYYDAITRREFRRAYEYWGASGPPNQSLETFTNGFRDTASAELKTGKPSRVEGAAGSQYIEIPVTIVAKTRSGQAQRFDGMYTLRRSVVDGSRENGSWHIYRASIRQVAIAGRLTAR